MEGGGREREREGVDRERNEGGRLDRSPMGGRLTMDASRKRSRAVQRKQTDWVSASSEHQR